MLPKMQLIGGGGGASPFVRKVTITAQELGISDKIEGIKSGVSPLKVNDLVNSANPLGKVPALVVTDEGGNKKIYFDSTVIIQYLDFISNGRKVLPPPSVERYDILAIEALADGIMEACLLARYEGMFREPEHQSAGWLEGQHAKIERGIKQLAKVTLPDPTSTEPFPVHGIAAACSLWYVGRRHPQVKWTTWGPECAKLKEWFDLVEKRPSWVAEVVDG